MPAKLVCIHSYTHTTTYSLLGNDSIEQQLKKDKANLRNEVKMLLLGAGESGKSTILKQMKLIHQGSYSPEERDAYREIIFSNTVQSMRVIIEAMEMMGIQLSNPALNSQSAQVILSLPAQIDIEMMTPQVFQAIGTLWSDSGVQQTFSKSREYQLNDSAQYYFDSIDRMASPQYLPTDQDVLRSRVKTTGITETTFKNE